MSRSPGRPKLPPAERRESLLRVRVTTETHKRYRECAQQQGIAVAEWARFWLAQGLEADRSD